MRRSKWHFSFSSRQPRRRCARGRSDHAEHNRRRVRRTFESLEPRLMLSGAAEFDYGAVDPAWFETPWNVTTSGTGRAMGSLSGANGIPGAVSGDAESVDRWVVRFTPGAVAAGATIRTAEHYLDQLAADFQVVRGLGLPGQVLVESFAPAAAAQAALESNPHVAYFEPDSVIRAQATPNDPDFPGLINLHNVGQFGAAADADIDAPEAWAMNVGSPSVVVGVIDSGVDLAHPDLYLNIWINQGEIRPETKGQLVDSDGDGLFTFYDLNDPANAGGVRDYNANGCIDAQDLLRDPRWADGLDTDRNGFVDDLFGWNFRAADDEPFAPNYPGDVLGHGTHVAGTIGAIGNNGRGVTGINWRSSIMALKFLDQYNLGQMSHAIAAINYAAMMREQYGANVRVLNNSWGQAGGGSQNLRAAIEASAAADILFVAAAGNGNVLGQGVNNDRTPFYPASYATANILSVAATGPDDRLGRFSNYGPQSVDLAAPGIGILSTLPGGRYGTANGTSMAAPHVSGVAALIWAEVPEATVGEVRTAILDGADVLAELQGRVVTGGRLNAANSLNAQAFAPRAALADAPGVTVAGGADSRIVVRYRDRVGIDETSLDDGDIVVSRQWGPEDVWPATLVPGSVTVADGGLEVTAVYRVAAPDGSWDPLDYGRYVISIAEHEVRSHSGLTVPAGVIGEFTVRIVDSSVFYVDAFIDAVDANAGDGTCADAQGRCTLRAAVQEANAAAPTARTIILDPGTYTLSVAPVPAPNATFLTPSRGCTMGPSAPAWSNDTTGDLDILGNVTIAGDGAGTSTVDAAGVDRAFRVHPGAALTLRRTGVRGGLAPSGQDGGGILTAGTLQLDTSLVAGNSASAGGGVAVWDGLAQVSQSTIRDNEARGYGGGLFVCNGAGADVDASTIARNVAPGGGAGILSYYGGQSEVTNSTISGNDSGTAPQGAVVALPAASDLSSTAASLSADGRFVAFASAATNLVAGDTNGAWDVFVYDRLYETFERVSVADDGTQGNLMSHAPSISADGRFVAFESAASNLVPGDTNLVWDIFVYDRQSRTVERVSVADNGTQGDHISEAPSLSADGRFVAFASKAANLVPGDTNDKRDTFVYDRQSRTVERVSVADDGTQSNGDSGDTGLRPYTSLSADGRFVAFASRASNLVPDDTNGAGDVFVYDRQSRTVERISVADDGIGGNQASDAPSISADGRFVAFASYASNLVPTDTNGSSDVFVYDRRNRTVERVSVADDGTQGNADSGDEFGHYVSLSADGRFVAFESEASNLAPSDTNGKQDVFVFDRQRRTVERVSLADDGSQGNAASHEASLSADGRFVAFEFSGSNLVSADTNEVGDILVYDRQNHEVQSVTVAEVAAPAIVLESVTVAENTGMEAVFGRVETHNSLFARNNGLRDWGFGTNSLGYNVLSAADPRVRLSPSDQTVPKSNAWLGPLADHGGATWTHALFSGPAVDNADPARYPQTDQAGVLRPQDGNGSHGPQPDIGAVEAFRAEVRGTVFLDLNQDGQRAPNEPGLPGQSLYIDVDQNGSYDLGEPTVTSSEDDPSTPTVVEQGMFLWDGLEPGSQWIAAQLAPGWSRKFPGMVERISVANDGTQTDGPIGPYASPHTSVNTDGRFVAFESWASNLVPGDTNAFGDIFMYDRQNQTVERISVADDGTQGNEASYDPSLSADGRFVAFDSAASNLVPGDTNGAYDIFVYDRQSQSVERISLTYDGTQSNGDSWYPSMSADGRFVAFASRASNLVPDDTNQVWDIFVYDRWDHSVQRVSVADDGEEGNDHSSAMYGRPSISGNGRFVAFQSNASNLVPDDTNWSTDIFVYDRQSQTIERVSVADDGTQGDWDSQYPSISEDGRFVAFQSWAANLTSNDTDWYADVFVYDRQSRTIECVSMANDGTKSQGEVKNQFPSISADGRFVAFESSTSNLAPGDTNQMPDAFVYDRRSRSIERISVADGGTLGNDASRFPAISGDGRFVVFEADASNLVPGDTNGDSDVFVRRNLQAPGAAATSVGLFAGQRLSGIDFALVPDPGEIRGTCFEDQNANGVRDEGEPALTPWTVYLDGNGNGRWDSGEPKAQTAADGSYAFSGLASHREYQLGVVVPEGFTLVLPTADAEGFWRVFLPAGGTVANRDFGVRKVATGGQFQNAVIRGRLFQDDNRNGLFDEQAGEAGLAGWTVFLDLNDDGVRQFDEPQTITSADDPGVYSFPGLGNRPYTVRVIPEPRHLQIGPAGNQFNSQERSLSLPTGAPAIPRDVLTADFTGDGRPDVAVALDNLNAISLLVNDGQGRFNESPVTIELASTDLTSRGYNPAALVAGDFNGTGSLDLAVVNNGSANVAILLDFTGTRFASQAFVPVGWLPTSVAAGDIDGDGKVDFLAVTNEAGNNVSILRNDGHGRFTADPNPIPVGNAPFAVVTGHFNNDSYPDLAVANYGTIGGGDLGQVRILLADGPNAFHAAQPACEAGDRPVAIVVDDFDGDGNADLAVANFGSNDVTVCAGAGNGTFTAGIQLSAGSGPMDIAAANLTGYGGSDILVASGASKNIAILRNRSTPGSFRFEPAESYGVADFTDVTNRMALDVGDLDGNGTSDLAVANAARRNVSMHSNTVVGGAHRVALTGVETASGLDFGFQSLNAMPTLDAIPDPLAIYEDPGVEQAVSLSGITAGGGETQPLEVNAAGDNPALFASLTVDYASPGSTGTLRYALADDQYGTAVVTVTVTDGGLDGDLATSADNASFTRSLTIRVNPLNDPPTLAPIPDPPPIAAGSPMQTVPLSGITAGGGESQPLRVTAVAANNPGLFAAISVEYNSPEPTGILRYTPAPQQAGMAVIVVTVTDGGLDGQLGTPGDNLSCSDFFIVIVNPAGPLSWQNPANRFDVNNDGRVTAEDVLILINYINSIGAGPLPNPPAPPPFFDVDGQGDVTPGDVIAIINHINANPGSGEAEDGAFVALRPYVTPALVPRVAAGLATRVGTGLSRLPGSVFDFQLEEALADLADDFDRMR